MGTAWTSALKTASGSSDLILGVREQFESLVPVPISISLMFGAAVALFLGLWHGVQTIRSVVRPLVVRQVEKGIVFVERLQSYRNRTLSTAVWISCQTVSVDFYEKMLPLFYWVRPYFRFTFTVAWPRNTRLVHVFWWYCSQLALIDTYGLQRWCICGDEQVVNPRAAANLIFVLGLCIYLGNFLKDLFCAPRPREVAERLGKGAKVKYLACKDSHAKESAKARTSPDCRGHLL